MSGPAWAQGQALPDVKVNLPPPPSFERKTAPAQYDSGEYSVFGLRKEMSQHLDKDVQLKAYLVEIYECPVELRACNESNPRVRKQILKGREPVAEGECRPCDQPHFFVADAPDARKSRWMLVADYPTEDWKTHREKPLDSLVKVGEQYVVTGTFAINSVTGFAASNGLIAHKRIANLEGKALLEGNAVLPPDQQVIELEGQPAEKLKLK